MATTEASKRAAYKLVRHDKGLVRQRLFRDPCNADVDRRRRGSRHLRADGEDLVSGSWHNRAPTEAVIAACSTGSLQISLATPQT